MSDTAPNEDPTLRIGHAEREAAVTALRRHHDDGRLDDKEFQEREDKALLARAHDELDRLFTDLPEPHWNVPAKPSPTSSSTEISFEEPQESSGRGLLAVPERYADTIAALTPLAAVALFFVTEHWEWFLAIPVMAILLYGPEGQQKKKKKKR